MTHLLPFTDDLPLTDLPAADRQRMMAAAPPAQLAVARKLSLLQPADAGADAEPDAPIPIYGGVFPDPMSRARV